MAEEVVKSVQFKISLEEWKAWKHESFDQGTTLSNMIRNVVNASLVERARAVPAAEPVVEAPQVIKSKEEVPAAVAKAQPAVEREFHPITKKESAR